ncbi:MAG: redox-regulated ATPase YchF [Pirellulales bacterium]|nr:redox-regulated ATPase YchF [Pirellulales bacterium]
MKIGLVGYQGSGKSTLFEWLTGVAADAALSHSGQSAMAEIPEPRIDALVEIYHPKKITRAAIELVDTPGLSRDHQGNATRLALLREAGCLVLVVAAFDGSDPMADLRSFDEDLMLADMEILSGRLERVAQSLTKPIPRPEREQLEHEQRTLQIVLEAMEVGRPLREGDMTDDQLKVTRAFRLLSEKPRMVVVNTADDEEKPERFTETSTDVLPVVAVPAGLELELARMSPEDRAEFEAEMGVGGSDRDGLIHRMLATAGQMIFFTAGEKEVRTWLLPQGGTALDAAAGIHTDLARGFIRAEIMTCADLVRLGSEREVKAQHLVRQEPKDYVVQDDDILLIRFSV